MFYTEYILLFITFQRQLMNNGSLPCGIERSMYHDDRIRRILKDPVINNVVKLGVYHAAMPMPYARGDKSSSRRCENNRVSRFRRIAIYRVVCDKPYAPGKITGSQSMLFLDIYALGRSLREILSRSSLYAV